MFIFIKKLLLPRAQSYFCKVSAHSADSLAGHFYGEHSGAFQRVKAAFCLLSLRFLVRDHISSPVSFCSAVNVSEGVCLDRESKVNPIKCDFTFSSGTSLCKHSLTDHPPVGLRLLGRRGRAHR